MDQPGDDKPDDDLQADEKPKPAARPKARAGQADAEAEQAMPNSPAVMAVLESHPTTPAELLRAINILADLNHPELAIPLVDELAHKKLDITAKAALANQFNSATLIKLARDPQLAAAMGPLVDDLLKSAEAFRRDPKRLAAWARQLSDPRETVRAAGTVALLRAREAAVAPLVDVLADSQRLAEHRAAQEILVELDELAVGPLLGVLESPDAALKARVIEVLGQIRAPQAVAQLLGPLLSPSSPAPLRAAAAAALESISGHVPNPPDALRLLEHAAGRGLEQSRRDDEGGSAPAELWHWNAKRKQSMPIQYDATGASLAMAARLARDLYQLDPHHAAHRRLYLTALLQAAKFRIGLDKPLATGAGTAAAVAARQGENVVDDLLADAMAKGFIPAATAAAQILGDIGSADLVARGAASPSPLVLAAAHADRRLRFTAIDAIMKLKPREPFAGSSRVIEGLGYFASSWGVPRLLVAHPRSEQGQKLAALAAELGYDSDVATNGRRAFELAVHSPDYEFALIHSTIDRPAVDELLAQLRRDRRTALLSVGLMAPWDDLERVRRFARASTRAEAFLEPQNSAEMKLFSEQVLSRGGRWHVSPRERKEQAVAALDWLVDLVHRPRRAFDVRRQEPAVARALFVDELSTRAADVLGQLGTATAQRSLLELADLPTQSLETRQAAATALAEAIHRYGILLTSDELLRQYDLYNANAGRDADTHAVLGAVLDAIEQKKNSARE
jgi:HEAT repeat protein